MLLFLVLYVHVILILLLSSKFTYTLILPSFNSVPREKISQIQPIQNCSGVPPANCSVVPPANCSEVPQTCCSVVSPAVDDNYRLIYRRDPNKSGGGTQLLHAPPTAHMIQSIFLFAVAVYTLGGYNWRHRGDFSISTFNPFKGPNLD